MYLRSYKSKKGWHENKNQIKEESCDQRSGERLNKLNKYTTGSGDIINQKLYLSSSSILWSSNSDWQSLEPKNIYQLGLERGMSDGERAVTTPRIGWRKLTDPGD